MSDDKVFRIEGLDCADCAAKIEGAVSRITGITSAQVLISSSKLLVRSDDNTSSTAIIQAVEQLGYKVAPPEATGAVSLRIEGMDCADEVRVLEKKLRELPGLLSFEIRLASQTIDAIYNPAQISPPYLIRIIAETGMRAQPAKTKIRVKTWWQDARIKFIAASGIFLAMAFILEKAGLNHIATRFIYGASILIGSYYPARMSLAGLRARTLNIYTLLIIAVTGAIILGFWDEAALLVFVYTWGAILETYATERARGSLRLLIELAPREALIKRDGREMTVPVEEVRIGEIVVVKPGTKVPLDGIVISGSSTVDQAPITGESMAVSKDPGDIVFAASINQLGSLEIRVNKLSRDTTLAQIINSVERSETKKSSYQHFAERFGQIYTPIIFGIAIIIAVVPWLFGKPFTPWFYRGLVTLVVSCSCGLVLSVPISILASISAAARKGILIKGGADLEAASKIEAVVFDKTGTLTIGLPTVTDIIAYDGDPAQLLSLAASVEAHSEHPLAGAILRKAREDGVEIHPFAETEVIVGLGIRGRDAKSDYYLCSRRLCNQMSIPLEHAEKNLTELESAGKTAVLVLSQNKVIGIIAVADKLRPEAANAISDLRKTGIKRTIMLTGDNEEAAKTIASQAGIDEYQAQLLPADKVTAIKSLRQRYGRIAMIGDGINDAPAMATADVGIAMGAAGTDIALETSDMALMSDDLSRIPHALTISRKAMATIKQNITASLAIVALVVTLALTGKISLVPGLLINEVSALVVMANGLRLLKSQ